MLVVAAVTVCDGLPTNTQPHRLLVQMARVLERLVLAQVPQTQGVLWRNLLLLLLPTVLLVVAA